MERKVNAYHIRSLEGTALANKIYNEQRKEGWPGLAKETKEICKGLNITDVNTTYLTKNEYKLLANSQSAFFDNFFTYLASGSTFHRVIDVKVVFSLIVM